MFVCFVFFFFLGAGNAQHCGGEHIIDADFENDSGIKVRVAIAMYSVRRNLHCYYAIQYSLHHSANL